MRSRQTHAMQDHKIFQNDFLDIRYIVTSFQLESVQTFNLCLRFERLHDYVQSESRNLSKQYLRHKLYIWITSNDMYTTYMQGNLSHLHSLPDWNLPQAAFEYSIDTPPGMRALARGVPGLREITSCHAPSGIHTTKEPLFCPASDSYIQFLLYQNMLYLFLLYHIPVISDSVLSDSIPSYIRFRYISFHFWCSIRFLHQIWGYIWIRYIRFRYINFQSSVISNSVLSISAIPTSTSQLYEIPFYQNTLYQIPLFGYIKFRYINVRYINFHFCVISESVLSDSVISSSVISNS